MSTATSAVARLHARRRGELPPPRKDTYDITSSEDEAPAGSRTATTTGKRSAASAGIRTATTSQAPPAKRAKAPNHTVPAKKPYPPVLGSVPGSYWHVTKRIFDGSDSQQQQRLLNVAAIMSGDGEEAGVKCARCAKANLSCMVMKKSARAALKPLTRCARCLVSSRSKCAPVLAEDVETESESESESEDECAGCGALAERVKSLEETVAALLVRIEDMESGGYEGIVDDHE